MSGPVSGRGVVVALSVSVMLVAAACASQYPQRTPGKATVGVLPTAGAPAAGSGQTVPFGLAGERLDVAVMQLQVDEGLSASFDPVIPGKEPFREWGVCSTSPSGGHIEDGHGAVVVLHIGHFKCGGGSNSPTATGSPPGAAAVKAAWHQVADAFVRKNGAPACAGVIAAVRQQIAASGSSCQQVVRRTAGVLNRGDVRSVSRAVITSVSIQGGRATVFYHLTHGLQDLNFAVPLNSGLSFLGWSDMQRAGGKWLLDPVPA